MKNMFIVLAIMVIFFESAGAQIIDMHMHAYTDDEYWGGEKHHMGPDSPKSATELLSQVIAVMNKHDIEYALLSGSPEALRKWKKADKRFIGGYEYIGTALIDTAKFKQLIEEGLIQAFAEMGSVYLGETLADPKFEPYIKICERYNIPIGYHTGNSNPGLAYRTLFRYKNSDPLLIEDVLAKHPNLKIYLMHAGGGFTYTDHTIELMHQYPHVYADLGVMLWIAPKTQYAITDFLKKAKASNLLDRVMFGSDQMVWPDAITMSIEFLNSLDFLTEEEKNNIFYENAKRFLGLRH